METKEKLNEDYWRTSTEVADLLYKAGFNVDCSAYEPLIAVACFWLNEKGYKLDSFHVWYNNGELVGAIQWLDKTDREIDLAFITACCQHLIHKGK